MSTPVTVRSALQTATDRLRAVGVPDPQRDARVLLRWAAGWTAAQLAAEPDAPLPVDAAARFETAVAARVERRPVSQIIGRRAFFGRDFIVTENVLDPRPESETLVAAALAHADKDAPLRVLDLGVGSGCLLLSALAERPRATGLGIDASAAALAVAARNADQLGLADRVTLRQGDWLDGVAERFDLILCNPPYVTDAEYAALAPEPRLWEPRDALTPPADGRGDDGLSVYRALIPRLGDVLAEGGAAFFELGRGQACAVAAIAATAGFKARALADLGGVDRVVAVANAQRDVNSDEI